MSRQNWSRLVIVIGILLVLLSAFISLARADAATATIGVPFTLENQDGRSVSDSDLKGAPYAIVGFAHCPEVCPTTLWEISPKR